MITMEEEEKQHNQKDVFPFVCSANPPQTAQQDRLDESSSLFFFHMHMGSLTNKPEKYDYP